jgi:hypothetical protein
MVHGLQQGPSTLVQLPLPASSPWLRLPFTRCRLSTHVEDAARTAHETSGVRLRQCIDCTKIPTAGAAAVVCKLHVDAAVLFRQALVAALHVKTSGARANSVLDLNILITMNRNGMSE